MDRTKWADPEKLRSVVFGYDILAKSLTVFASEAEAIAAVEGLTIAEGDYKFFSADGSHLEAVFSIPAQIHPERNTYMIHKPQDKLVYSFDWFSPQLTLKTGKITDSKMGISFVRVLTDSIEFYFDGKMVRRYLAEELANTKAQWASIRFWRFLGYQWINASSGVEGHLVYDIYIVNRVISFDPIAGTILGERKQPDAPPQALTDMINGSQDK